MVTLLALFKRIIIMSTTMALKIKGVIHMNLTALWTFKFLIKHCKFTSAIININGIERNIIALEINMKDIDPLAKIKQCPVVGEEALNSLFGRIDYFNKCIRLEKPSIRTFEHDGKNFYSFTGGEDYAMFVTIAYVFLVNKENKNFTYTTLKGVVVSC
jgi:hypothetical protein